MFPLMALTVTVYTPAGTISEAGLCEVSVPPEPVTVIPAAPFPVHESLISRGPSAVTVTECDAVDVVLAFNFPLKVLVTSCFVGAGVAVGAGVLVVVGVGLGADTVEVGVAVGAIGAVVGVAVGVGAGVPPAAATAFVAFTRPFP